VKNMILAAFIYPVVAIAALGLTDKCHAIPISLNFDSLVSGTVLTTQLQSQNVIFSGIQSGGHAPGLVLDVVAADLNVLSFGNSEPNAILIGVENDLLQLEFVTSDGSDGITDFVSLRAGDGDLAPESFRISFFNLAGDTLMLQEYTTTSGSVNGGVTVSLSQPGIHRIEFLGVDSGPPRGSAIDDLTFNPIVAVPEATTIVIFAFGLVWLGFLRRQNIH
jgi:hypothetical protein